MSNWHNIANTTDIPPGAWQVADFEHISLLVFNLNGEFYAIENVCTHDGGSLSDGCLLGEEIMCPRHGARFSIKTGEVTAPPAYENIDTYPVRVENGMVQVEITN